MAEIKTKKYEAKILETISETNDCDAACKRVLSMRSIVAPILKHLMPEFKDISIETIKAECIGSPSIGDASVNADELPPVIPLDNTEDTTVLEGKRLYDVKFTATVPSSPEKINLIINIEAQKNFSPGYALVRRGIYYCSRLISAQYGTIFSHSDFGKLQKVYSIWICTRPNEDHENTIEKFCFTPAKVFGDPKPTKKSDYDLMTVIMVCLDNSTGISCSENDIIKMLSVILNSKESKERKYEILENDLGISMTKLEKEGMDDMCNISQGYIEMGIEEGIKKGEEKVILTMLKNGKTPKEIAEFVGIPIEKAERIEKKYMVSG